MNTRMPPLVTNGRVEIVAHEFGQVPQSMSPQLLWSCQITAAELAVSNSPTIITIPSVGFVPGRLRFTFTGGGLPGPVSVNADANVGDTENDLAAMAESNIDAEPLLDGVVEVSSNLNQVTITPVEGIDPLTITYTFTAAQVIEILASGSVGAGDYVLIFDGFDLVSPVPVTTSFVGGTPTDLAIAIEAAIEAEAALSSVVDNADDDGAGLNTVQIRPGRSTGTITLEGQYKATFGAPATDGNHVLTFISASLPGSVPVTVVRAGGVPVGPTELATAMVTEIDNNVQLDPLVEGVTSSGAVVLIDTFAGVTFTFDTAVPGGTLTTEDGVAISDATTAGPIITSDRSLDLTAFKPNDAIVTEILRQEVWAEVTEAWPAGSTLLVDDAGVASTEVLEDVDLTALGVTQGPVISTLAAAAEAEAAWQPRALVTDAAQGAVTIWVVFGALPE